MYKKMFFLFAILIFSANVSALTIDESKEVATFAKNLIVNGMKGEHIDNNGMPILAYMQGPARIYGYQSSLYYINNSYNNKIQVKSKKWNFDCSSFVSYVLKETLGMRLLNSNYLGGNPYMVSNFVNDKTNFDTIYSRIDKQKLLSVESSLLPGDILIIIGSHIGMYVGNGEVAEASNKFIGDYSTSKITYKGEGKYNLGTGISSLEGFAKDNDGSRYSVLRIKKTLSAQEKINTTITWPDTGKMENLGSNSDFEIAFNDDYTKKVTVTLKMTNEGKIKKYAISEDNNFNYLDGNNTDTVNLEITKNGKYNIFVIDGLNNILTKSIEIQNIDNTSPEVVNIHYQNNQIIIDAADFESGLADEAYSYDMGITWTDKNIYSVTPGNYTIMVRDKLGNISQKEYSVEALPVETNHFPTVIVITCIIIVIAIIIILYSIFKDAKKSDVIIKYKKKK